MVAAQATDLRGSLLGRAALPAPENPGAPLGGRPGRGLARVFPPFTAMVVHPCVWAIPSEGGPGFGAESQVHPAFGARSAGLGLPLDIARDTRIAQLNPDRSGSTPG